MINGLGVLGWGVGGIEAEAAMLGQPVSMLIPEVIGFKLSGKLKEGITATDLVLTVTQMLREGRVGKFVEFYGDGLADLPLADRATIANMAPEYGATCGFFPDDEITLGYLRLSGRPESTVKLVEATKAQGLWRSAGDEPVFTDSLSLDMGTVEASLAGRPQDRVPLTQVASTFDDPHRPAAQAQRQEDGRLLSERRWHRRGRQRAERRDGLRIRGPHPSPRRRRRGDRRHHLPHQHLQPQRDDGRRPAARPWRRA